MQPNIKYRSKRLIQISCLGVMFTFALLIGACKKDWLNAKPNKALVVPSTVSDYQNLLDNNQTMNTSQGGLYTLGDGDFYVTDTRYNTLSAPEMGAYIWADTKTFYGGAQNSDWISGYNIILNANIVLDGLQSLKIDAESQTSFNNVKGSALFFRSLCFYNLAQAYCKLYNSATATTDLGLPLRLSSNVNINVTRSSVQKTYDQIIGDLVTAAPMLPIKPLFLTRPSRPAVFGLLSRVYLSQQNYAKAFLYADSCLQLNNSLMDFNTLLPSASYPIPMFNSEVIFQYVINGYAAFRSSRLIVDSVLYRSYASNDLRSMVYFVPKPPNFSFKGSYDGDFQLFGGPATDEMYLIRAECYARTGNATSALNDLNTLLKTRWVTGTYVNMTAANSDAALALVLTERRKELCYRGLRWTDLKRLNTDPRFQTTLTRTVNGQTYTLSPNSPKYVLPLDDYEIQVGGLEQNPR